MEFDLTSFHEDNTLNFVFHSTVYDDWGQVLGMEIVRHCGLEKCKLIPCFTASQEGIADPRPVYLLDDFIDLLMGRLDLV
jgi:hypothetical protein